MLFSLCSRMMAVAVSASAAFLTPVGHSANVLVMGPGGYRFSDYTKVGISLTLVVLLIVVIVVPIFWPFRRITQMQRTLALPGQCVAPHGLQAPPDSQCKGDKIWNLPD